MMEVPNNAKHEEMMDLKKFAQSKGLIYSEDKVWIEGRFKEDSDKIILSDSFWAAEVHTSGQPLNAEEIYRVYLEWFNRTLKPFEKERFFVSAKFGDNKEVEE